MAIYRSIPKSRREYFFYDPSEKPALSTPKMSYFVAKIFPTFTLFNLVLYKNIRNCTKMLADVSYNTKNLASTYPDES